MNLTITRTYEDRSTTGTCQVGDKTLYTIELPWIDNETGVSCVPEGTYQLVPYMSPKHGATWVLVNDQLGVGFPPDKRAYCELHSANWAGQLEGCIAFGFEGHSMYNPATGLVEPAVEDSRDAIAYLTDTLGAMSHGHTLMIARAAT